MTRNSPAPLAGITVLDLSSYIAGPSGCALLADMGARVIKLEPPAGDALRHYPTTLKSEGRAFIGVNRSKRGIVIDLKIPAGLKLLHRLVATADVLVHNFRPSVPARLGMDYSALSAINPKLIMCNFTGYGQSGPMADRAGYDQILQCFTGIAAVQGQAKDGPELVYGSVVDFYAGALIASAVSAALFQREKTGKGQSIDLSLLGAALAMQATRMVWADDEPRAMERDLRSGGVTGIHPCAEGTYLYISANTPHFWKHLCRLIGRPELADDLRFDTVRKRAEHSEELLAVLHAALARHSAWEWEKIFGEAVPNGAVRAMEDMFDHPQVASQAHIAHLTHQTMGGYRGFAGAAHFSASAPPQASAAPVLGQHSDAVLAEFGLGASEIAELRRLGAVQ